MSSNLIPTSQIWTSCWQASFQLKNLSPYYIHGFSCRLFIIIVFGALTFTRFTRFWHHRSNVIMICKCWTANAAKKLESDGCTTLSALAPTHTLTDEIFHGIYFPLISLSGNTVTGREWTQWYELNRRENSNSLMSMTDNWVAVWGVLTWYWNYLKEVTVTVTV